MSSVFHVLWLFIIYSFLGWFVEEIIAAIKEKKFLNRGVLNGPFCPVYGIIFSIYFIFLRELVGKWFFLAVGSGVIALVVFLLTGKILRHMLGKRWWEFSQYRYNIEGYVRPEIVIAYAIMGACSVSFLSSEFLRWYDSLSVLIVRPFVFAVLIILVIDFVGTFAVVIKWRGEVVEVKPVTDELHSISHRMGRRIFDYVKRRISKAYPTTQKNLDCMQRKKVFAFGCGFYKLVWIFLICALVGDWIETIFCYFSMGYWMSRSSVIYGTFSIVWGLGGALLTSLLYRLRDREDRYIFLGGTIVGGVYEYICSVFTEIVFGTVFWDYSDIPFNLGGRVNLLYCFFWGIASLLWMKFAYPSLSKGIEKIPRIFGNVVTWICIVLMSCNIIISGVALFRYTSRQEDGEVHNVIEEWIDTSYPDSLMKQIYPKAVIK